MNGPDWSSTAIFLTWDDCGCQYDPLAPNRVPMIIISPFARAGYTDTRRTNFAGVVRFIEEAFGLPAMNNNDLQRYDYRNAFDFFNATDRNRAATVTCVARLPHCHADQPAQ